MNENKGAQPIEKSSEDIMLDGINAKVAEALKNDPLRRVIELVGKTHKGDALLACLLYLSGITATMNTDQLHVYIVGETGKGKSHLAMQVLRLFPKARYHTLSSVSPKGLLYAAEKLDLNGKIIYCDEAEATKEAIPVLRAITSSRTQGSGVEHWTIGDDRQFKRIEFKAPVVVWLSSVQPLADTQLKNRFIIINPDESKEQDQAVYELQKEVYGLGRENAIIEEEFSTMQFLTPEIMSAPKDVDVPFSKEMDFEGIHNRRNFPYFLLLVKAVARVYWRQRRIINNHVVATRFDFELAKLLWDEFIALQAAQVSKYALDVYAVIPENESEAIDNKGIAKALGCGTDKAYQRARELVKAGLVDRKKDERRWRYCKSQQKPDTLRIGVNWAAFTKEKLAKALNAHSDKPIDDLDGVYHDVMNEDLPRLSFYQRYVRRKENTQLEESKEGELRNGDNQSSQSLLQFTQPLPENCS